MPALGDRFAFGLMVSATDAGEEIEGAGLDTTELATRLVMDRPTGAPAIETGMIEDGR